MLVGSAQQIDTLFGDQRCRVLSPCHPAGTLAAEGDGRERRSPGPSASIASVRGIPLGGWLGRAVRRIRPGKSNNRQAALFLI